MTRTTIRTKRDDRHPDYRKQIIKVGETWMNGTNGVETIVAIEGKGSHKFVRVENVSGKQYVYSASDFGSGEYAVVMNLIFKIK